MKAHNLLLARKYSERPEHVHDRKVIVMRSNLRWCSDGFEFTWLGDIIHDASSLMPMTVRSSSGGLWSMPGSAGPTKALRAPATIQMLTDNRPPYTQVFARQLGLKPCFTRCRARKAMASRKLS
jgi:putative transposase